MFTGSLEVSFSEAKTYESVLETGTIQSMDLGLLIVCCIVHGFFLEGS